MNHVARLKSIPELRQFVLEVLCAKDNLDPVQTPLQQARVVRKGKPCGLFGKPGCDGKYRKLEWGDLAPVEKAE